MRFAPLLLLALPIAVSAGASPDRPPAPAPVAPAAVYRSAFDGYRKFGDQPLESWVDANDRVARIGGWRAYARESQETPKPPSADGERGHDAHHR